MQSTWEPQSGATLELDGMVKTFEHSQASSPRTSHTRLTKAWAKNGKRSGSGFLTWPDANVAPPVHRVDLTHPVVDAEHGKAVSVVQSRIGCSKASRPQGRSRGDGMERIE